MSDQVICPDCGGVIGASETDGVKVCHCRPVDYHPDPKLADQTESQLRSQQALIPVAEKICRICGKDLSGHRRLKDRYGYICLDCDRKEKQAAEQGLVSCGECGKKLKPEGLIDYHGTRICRKCFADHQEVSKFKAPPPKLDQHDAYEKKRLYILLVIAAVLGLIGLLSWWGILGEN